eukprot:gene3303-3788_t
MSYPKAYPSNQQQKGAPPPQQQGNPAYQMYPGQQPYPGQMPPSAPPNYSYPAMTAPPAGQQPPPPYSQFPPNQGYLPQQPAYVPVQNLQPGCYDSGARFGAGNTHSIPPPPPGVAPNAAQAAASQGQPVYMTQRQADWMSGASGGGYTVW